MADAARILGNGVREVGNGLAEMQAAEERVASAGYAARFEDLYRQALTRATGEAPETGRDELLQEAQGEADAYIERLPQDWRETARAQAASARDKVLMQAEQQERLDRVAAARNSWQQQVDEAVDRADEEGALQRLESGRELFVPEREMEGRRREVSSRCRAAAWQQRLNAAPLETLAAWKSDEQPQGVPERRAVENAMAATRQQLRHELGAAWSTQLQSGQQPDADEVRRAGEAGILPQGPQTHAIAEWQQRADALGDDAEAAAELRLQMAALDVPPSQRRELLAYLDRSEQLPAENRRELGAALHNLYRAGRFGCAGDAVPQRRLARLQREAQQKLATLKTEEVRDWLAGLSKDDTAWVCFEPLS